MTCGSSILFPNLYPYGSSSAVSLIDEQHFVEIGTASAVSYRSSFVLLSVESAQSFLELRIVVLVRSNSAPWVRSDYTGFEVMLGDMATFTAPEDLAAQARPFFAESGG
jgi:hypothetical protein